MIPPPRHNSENVHILLSSSSPRPDPTVAVPSSFNAGSDFSPTSMSSYTATSKFGSEREFGDDESVSSIKAAGKDSSVKLMASSAPTAALSSKPPPRTEKARMVSGEVQNDQLAAGSKTPKEKMSKAERRALQESQRAAKAAAKEANKAIPLGSIGSASMVNPAQAKAARAPSRKGDTASIAASEKKGTDRPSEKERKKDVPQPRMQYNDKSRVEKAKRKAVVKQNEARNRVELFRHLPQYEHGSQAP